MTPRYLPVAVVASQLRIGPRRLRTLLAEGRIDGAYRMAQWDRSTCYGLPADGGLCCHADRYSPEECMGCGCGRTDGGPWLIPADYRVSPRTTGPQLRIYRKDGGA